MEASASPDSPPLKAPAHQPARLRRDRATTPKRRITSLPLKPRSEHEEVPELRPEMRGIQGRRLSRSSWKFGDDGPVVDGYTVTVVAAPSAGVGVTP